MATWIVQDNLPILSFITLIIYAESLLLCGMDIFRRPVCLLHTLLPLNNSRVLSFQANGKVSDKHFWDSLPLPRSWGLQTQQNIWVVPLTLDPLWSWQRYNYGLRWCVCLKAGRSRLWYPPWGSGLYFLPGSLWIQPLCCTPPLPLVTYLKCSGEVRQGSQAYSICIA